MPVLAIDRFEGMSTLVASEKMPPYLLQEIINLELTKREGHLRKRKGYKAILSAGLTALANMTELVDENGARQIVLLDGTTLEESVYSGGSYGAIGSISNDERTAGSTITTFKPVNDQFVLRNGAGKGASTDRPFWYGYIEARNRFNSAETISAGKYLADQYTGDPLGNLFTNTGTIYGNGAFEAVAHLSRATGKDLGLTEAHYALYAAPVFDGYQKGFPEYIGSMRIGDSGAGNEGSMEIYLHVADVADALKEKRMTHVDLFVATSEADIRTVEEAEFVPAYFLERISLNDDTDVFYETAATGDNATSKITITNFADWLTFDALGLFIHNVTDSQYHRVTAETINGTSMEFTVTPAPTTTGGIDVKWLSRWYTANVSGTDYYLIRTFYDGHYKKLASEMFEYLGIPSGDTGLSDFRYQFGAMAGKRYFAFGFPDDKAKFGYYSVANAPDVIPSLNFLQLSKAPTGCVALNDESVLVFYKDSADLFTVFGNQNSRREQGFLQLGCTNHDSIVKIDDAVIAWMDYTGPALFSHGRLNLIGEQLSEWWDDTLSDTEKEGCVAAYNRKAQQLWFSFPDYTTSPYTTGIVFVFDLAAFQQKISAWYILKTDVKLSAAALASDLHLLTSNGTAIHDWNNASPVETLQPSLKLKVFNHPLLSKRVNLEKIHVDFTDGGSNAVTVKVYLDGSGTASLTATVAESSKEKLIEYVADTFELEFLGASGTDDFTFKSAVVNYEALRE